MHKELKRLKEDNEEVGEELKQAMGEVERLRAEVKKVRNCEERSDELEMR